MFDLSLLELESGFDRALQEASISKDQLPPCGQLYKQPLRLS